MHIFLYLDWDNWIHKIYADFQHHIKNLQNYRLTEGSRKESVTIIDPQGFAVKKM